MDKIKEEIEFVQELIKRSEDKNTIAMYRNYIAGLQFALDVLTITK